MKARQLFFCAGAILFVPAGLYGADSVPAARATNELGLDLFRQVVTSDSNTCLSPYSIESALAMTFAGADGQTRDEMANVLHVAKDDSVHNSFAALREQLHEVAEKSVKRIADSKKFGGPQEPITLAVANRLFAQKSYGFRENFLALVKERYGAALEPMDYAKDASGATERINSWVQEQTRNRIRDLIPRGALNAGTRLVLVNAIYLKAPWATPFLKGLTEPRPFHVRGGEPVNVPTMFDYERSCGYAKREGYTAVTIPYLDSELQLLILLPDDVNGLGALGKKITPEIFDDAIKFERRGVTIYLPKFEFEPPTMRLGDALEALGMRTAFDHPHGSANFDRLAPRTPNDYLFISAVFHKTFIALDEEGTEAAAATAVAMEVGAARGQTKPKPTEVKIDRPFFYAIQHVSSGACLFMGRVTDPR
ncbi:MAG TPA: serpin family protein [Chthoniobacterales bacterium]|nr:serpin family protein [Chthoniobacterales bacterium]